MASESFDPSGRGREEAEGGPALEDFFESAGRVHEALVEELRSAQEELACANEELTKTNEEFAARIEGLEGRNAELWHLAGDLSDILRVADIPFVALDSRLRIRRYTPSAGTAFRLSPADIGRPLNDLAPTIDISEWAEVTSVVFEKLRPLVKEVRHCEGRRYILRVRPYTRGDNSIGILLALHGIDMFKVSLTEIHDGYRRVGQFLLRTERELHETRQQTEKLHKLGSAMLDSEDSDSALERLPECIAEIFDVPGAALYEHATGRIFRAGPQAWVIPEDKLRQAAIAGERQMDPVSHLFVLPIRRAGGAPASLGLSAQEVSEDLLNEIAERTAVILARVYAAERAMAAEVARRTDELRSAVLDALMHEIKSPLNALNLSVEALAYRLDPRQRELLAGIKSETDGLNRRIDEAMRTAQIEAGDFSLNQRPTLVNKLISTSLREMGAALADREIETDVREPLPAADCDGAMAAHVLKLLLDNAAKYSPTGSPIKVCAKSDSGTIVFSVVSRGRTLTREERERVFEKYYRGREARSTGAPGTGLGLASAERIVEAHGGAIWVTPEPDGNGFHFSLPAAESV
jgi:signal transduction histidine kinase